MLGQDIRYDEIDDKRIANWKQRQYADMGFRDYFRKRDLKLLKLMGIGLTRDNYLIALGQRLELMALLQTIDQSGKIRGKKGRKKLSSNNIKAEK